MDNVLKFEVRSNTEEKIEWELVERGRHEKADKVCEGRQV
jgi:hypothetical protein